MSIQLEDRIDKLEDRVNSIEIMSARVEERISSLADACDNLRKTVLYFIIIFGTIMLGIIGYGAIGENGLHSVRQNLMPIISSHK